MAIYHLKSQVIGRSKGRSSVAAAAYRSGEMLVDERTSLVHNYTRKQGVAESYIEAPEDAPGWMLDRGRLWNEVERKERRRDSQLSRELDIALPVELTEEQQSELVRRYVREQFVERGMVADVNIHRADEGNPHFHVMLTMREVAEEGFAMKAREWNDSKLHAAWREEWARHANHELERAGSSERIDHRTLEAQGLDREPTRHEGPHVREMERRGIRTDRGELNRQLHRRNEDRERRRRLQEDRDQEATPHRPGTGRGRDTTRGREDNRGIDRDLL